MHFLPDVYVPCDTCHGARYNRDTLEIRYKGKNIAEVLDMTVEDACEFFRTIPSIYNALDTLNDVGLGYIKLGQAATTLSGGEAQRVKLATELPSARPGGRSISSTSRRRACTRGRGQAAAGAAPADGPWQHGGGN
jgi:excinuclease ABC subunit A